MGAARKRHARRLATLFIVLMSINGFFWFTADFTSFVPSSPGPFRERFLLTVVSGIGPIAWILGRDGLRVNSSDDVSAVFFALGLLGIIAGSIIVRHQRWLRFLAIVAVILWVCAGCMATSLHIT